ncbi:MAG: hypothetical protein A3B08_01990 [Candidatus Taylorbacteria bacterium RIFCSPLOWO2_01_FULL_43_44]|nr:MAG: hypothetical protein A3B08_01990 [Candidatus Taylorbacteria bacterium RIFCSPLOWO2_01_FULL_43_44]
MKTLFLIIFFLFFLVVVNADAAVLMRPANNLGLAPLEARAMSAADASRRLASNGAGHSTKQPAPLRETIRGRGIMGRRVLTGTAYINCGKAPSES